MKKLIFPTIIFCLIFYINLVAAQSIGITVQPENLTVQLSSTPEYTLTIKNNQPFADSFVIFVSGPNIGWINLEKYYVELNPNATRTLKLWFYSVNKPGSFEYKVAAESLKNPAIKNSVTIYLNVITVAVPEKPKPVFTITSFTTEKIGNELIANLSINSSTQKQITIDLELRDSKGNKIISKPLTAEVYGLKIISTKINLVGLLAGSYSVQASVRGTALVAQSTFSIPALHNITKSKKMVSNPLFTQISWEIKNSGNVVEYNFSLQQVVEEGFITYITPPTSCEGRICKWIVDKIEPGKGIEISYRIEHWLPVVIWIIIILIICIAVYLWITLARPIIKKGYIKRKREREFTITLDIKGSWLHKMGNVIIRDYISPLAKVEKPFETVKPKVKISDAGTELVWKLGTLQPHEHRILHYRIKTIVHGSLRMPRAIMRFRTAKGKWAKKYSKELILEA